MLDSARFFQKLDDGRRVRLPIAEAWRAFQKLYPKISISTEARSRLAELLTELVQKRKIRFPQGKKGWDFGTRPSLPHWIEILREKTPDSKPGMHEIAWPPELAFAASLKSRSHLEVLLRIREWLAGGGRKAALVPLKERSAEILGDEKRLDQLLKTDLFLPGALGLDTLRCYPVHLNLVWERGPTEARNVLIIENSNTYHSFCAWNAKSGEYAACVYGHGFMIHQTHEDLQSIMKETNSGAAILYFGDLDVPGIRIPVELGRLLNRIGLPTVKPAERWYGLLLDRFPEARAHMRRKSPGTWTDSDLAWFSAEVQVRVRQVFEEGYRIPQELVGTHCLQHELGSQPSP
jgi:hypothetical protein